MKTRSAVLIFCAVIAQGCITSKHWDATLNDPREVRDIENRFRSEEDVRYWEQIEENRWLIGPFILEDSIDKANEQEQRRKGTFLPKRSDVQRKAMGSPIIGQNEKDQQE